MKKIYIFRHGQTAYNERGVLQGRAIDAPLNDTGREQVDAFYDAYKEIPFELVITSELKRSIQSVYAFVAAGKEHVVDERITEFSWGSNEGKPLNEIVVHNYRKMLKAWYEGNLDFRIPGGESGMELQSRVRDFVSDLKAMNQTRILICTHGRTMKMLIVELLGLPVEKMEDISHSNTALFEFDCNGRDCSMIRANDISHLPDKLKVQTYWDK